VLVVMIDDAGFGSSSAFGGPCQTPTFERLAAPGLKFNRFHTTALCSPTRQALLTGRNHHAVGMGGVTEISGFEYFYGFVGAETRYPALYDGVTPIEPSKTPEQGYRFTEDMADKAITWVGQQKSLMPDKPFFMHCARGGHAERHVQRDHLAQRRRPVRDAGVHGGAHRRVRHAGGP